MSQLFAGIDWGGAHHQVAVVDPDGREVWNCRFAHDREGLDDLIGCLTGLADLAGVAIERSEGLLVERLQRHGLRVFPVSPRTSARARERYQAAARKNDRFDAFVLADTLRSDGWRWRPLAASSALHGELRAVVRHRRQCCESQLAVEWTAFDELAERWGGRYPAIIRLWESAWEEFIPFLDYDVEIRQVICSTNAIESLNARYRRAVRARGHFPSEQAALKCLYLVTRSLDPTGTSRTRWTMRWKPALNAFAITFADRFPAAETR